MRARVKLRACKEMWMKKIYVYCIIYVYIYTIYMVVYIKKMRTMDYYKHNGF